MVAIRASLRVAAAAAAASLVVASSSCTKAPPSDEAPTSSDVALASSGARPVDHIAPDELLEGAEMAFGVKLPRAAHVDGAFTDVVYATVRAPRGALVAYYRTRVREGTLRQGAQSATTTFEHAKVPGKPGLEVSVQIREVSPQECRLEVRDTTPVPPPAGSTPEEKWRTLGMKPNGQPLDPTKVE